MFRTNRNLFSKHDMEVLMKNPNVEKVSERRVVFTPEFKERAYYEIQSGKLVKNVFLDAGIDPEILGENRIYSFAQNLKNKAKDYIEFSDRRVLNGHSEEEKLKVKEQCKRETHHFTTYPTDRDIVRFIEKTLREQHKIDD